MPDRIPTPISVRAPTRDGVLLGMRRYPRAGAPPVLMLHGFAQNLDAWDLPVPGHSLAMHLSALGFDVWLGNFRGHGRAPLRSGEGERQPRIDDFGVLDLPAMIDRVRRHTGRAPLLVGHSMGGIATLIYLQGAHYDEEGRVVQNPALAARRNREVAGAALVAVPPVLAWKKRPHPLGRMRGDYWEYNTFLQGLVGRRATIGLLDRLPLGSVRAGAAAAAVRGVAGLPGPLGLAGARVSRIASKAMTAAMAHTLWNPGNMSDRVVDAETREVLDDMSVPVLRQFADWIHHGTMREYVTDDPERTPHVYSDHFGAVRVPLLFVAGDRDRLAPASSMQRHGVLAVGSREVSFLVMRGFGHNDLRTGRRAPAEFYPRIARWLGDRSAADAGGREALDAVLSEA